MAKAEKNSPVFLKCIEIQGFKSFADRLKIELGQGMSVIVGPNGSGKSNVADAVRWVLGEQSAKSLRGTKMEDVIFAGSAKRRPVGMAEVSLVFDNSRGIFPLDFQEVTITRRVYRDGESQYFINKAPCRLKDIQELFMDTGAGKEGFSIIGQGRVEEILTLKSEERRALIEEAAGITKFRARKKEAMKRLEDTDQNLARLADILAEIESQLEPLAEQAQIAEESLRLTEELKKTEIQVVVSNLTEAKAKLDTTAANIARLKEEFIVASVRLGDGEKELLAHKLELQNTDHLLQAQQGVVHQAEQEYQNIVHEIELRKERIGNLEEQYQLHNRELNDLFAKQKQIEEKINVLESKLAVLTKTVDEAKSDVSQKESQLSAVRSETVDHEIEILKGEIFAALSEQTSCSNELTGINHTLSSIEHRKSQLKAEREKKEIEFRHIKEKIHAHNEEEQKLAKDEEDYLKQQNQVVQKVKDLRERIEQDKANLNELNRQMDRKRARLQVLKSLEDSLEGYQRGVREVILSHKKGVKECAGVCGTVADLLTVEKTYEIAIETALGGNLQNIVTETLKDAKECIAYLKARQLGRATFLPLDEIRGARFEISPQIKKDPGFKGLAVDLVNFEKRYEPAINFLLGRVIIAEDMDAAARIAKMTGYKARVVTLDGDQVNVGGSLSGGSLQRRGENILGRGREIEELKRELANSQRRKEELEKSIEQHITLQEELKLEIQKIQSTVNQIAEQRTRLKVTLEGLYQQDRRIEQELELLKLEEDDLEKEYEERKETQQELTNYLSCLEAKVKELREQLAKKEQQVKDSASEADSLNEELTKSKVLLAKLEQELAQSEQLLKQEQGAFEENKSLIEQKEELINNISQSSEAVKNELKGLQNRLSDQEKVQLSQQEKLASLRLKREELSARVLAGEENIEKERQKVQEYKEKIHQEELNCARWETEWETGVNRLQEEFGIAWEEGEQYQVDQSRAVLLRTVQELKRQIDALGPVNHAAIEEYPKTLSRFQFLTAQRDDLVEARDKLIQLIADLDRTMSERFKEGFTAVNQAFQQVFTELFNGGHAELRLEDPANVLETGVEIIAQPPGKKPQYLSLLSGGEKALTAIGLLFALLKVKPSPFCILDEIEASLDDANVQRFAEYVRRFSSSTQFLVISHRKGTMEAADTLYGITMEESGVSKLLTVQLDEREPYTA